MSVATAPVSSFCTGSPADELFETAAAATTTSVEDPSHGVLVIVLRPNANDHQVIAGGGTGVLRAAVSVAVAAGNDRLWRDAPVGTTSECSTRALPEVVAAAADAAGVQAAHIGVVRHDAASPIDAVVMWFQTWNGVARADDRRTLLALLDVAARNEAERRGVAAEVLDESVPDLDESAVRRFDVDDPRLDPVTGVLIEDAFVEALEEFAGDEATVVLVDLDDFERVVALGDGAVDQILREIADRLVSECRRDDTIARLGPQRFGILFGDLERSAVLHVAKRLLTAISGPLPAHIGVTSVTATLALAHQAGLVDLDEMMESAADAVRSGKRSGAGRLVLAA